MSKDSQASAPATKNARQGDWHQSACILCASNCGIEVQLGGASNREIVRTRGDKAHPGSKGYLCNKASRLNHYQNRADRLTEPMRRNSSGGYDPINWDTAIAEIAEKLGKIRDTCLLYTSPSPRDKRQSRMPSSA